MAKKKEAAQVGRFWLMQDHTDLRIVASEEAPQLESNHGKRQVRVVGMMQTEEAARELGSRLAQSNKLTLLETEEVRS